MKKKLWTPVTVGVLAALFATSAIAAAAPGGNASQRPLTFALTGDWPYGAERLSNAQLLVHSVNGDPNVSFVMHVGDIHSGSQPCTGAGLDPRPSGSNPTYNLQIFDIFQQFEDPFVYTPGDNEWTDCHKTKEKSSGAPLNELAAVRNLFFAQPGQTLAQSVGVLTEARDFNAAFPTDAQYVENVMFSRHSVVFVTLNVPGSNDDGLVWTAPFTDESARTGEVAQRDAANTHWLAAAFERAQDEGAAAVVIGLQADMWDPEAFASGGDGLNNYDALVQQIANLSVEFGQPVLLVNGDSHVFAADSPLADPNSATGQIHHTQAVPNLTRITVQGSTTTPGEWTKLTIDPSTAAVFSWTNVVYDPL